MANSFIRGYEKGIKNNPLEPEWRELEAENVKLKAEVERLKGDIVVLKNNLKWSIQQRDHTAKKNYWRWVGDGTDDLDTLSCPVLIDAAELSTLRELKGE